MSKQKQSDEFEQFFEFLPPGLKIDPTTKKAVELSAQIAAKSDVTFHKKNEPPSHPHVVYDFISRRAYFNEINLN